MLQQLRQRKIVQYGLGYVAAAAALFGGLVTVGQVFDWPDAVLRALFFVLLAGFFVTLVLAWFHGEQGRQGVTAAELSLLVPIIGLGAAGAFGALRGEGHEDAGKSSVDRHSVAVLPFVNMSGNAENEYFSDGITEEILNALATLTDLKVSARTSSFAFKGQNLPIPEIAEQLGVSTVVEGSVRRTGDQVRITAQLIDAATDVHLWSEQYDRSLSDVFAVQTEIAMRIADELNLRLKNVGERRGTRDPAALDSYLRGLAALNALDYDKARDQLSRAVARDSGFALAYAALSDALSQLDEAAAAKAAALKAVQLDDQSPEAHTALAYTLGFHDWRWQDADRAYARALELRPGHVPALALRAYMYAALGRKTEALAHIDRAYSLDPLSLRTTVDRALIYNAYDPAQALKEAQRARQLDPANRMISALIGELQWRLDRKTEARATWTQLRDSFNIALANHDTARARAIFRRREERATRYSALNRASYYARLREHDRAFALLDSAAAERYRLLALIRWDYDFNSLRGDPRFAALLQRMGLPLTQ